MLRQQRQELFVIAGVLLTVATATGAFLLARTPDPPVVLRLLTALCGGASIHLFRLAMRKPPTPTTLGSAAITPPGADLLESREPGDGRGDGSILIGQYEDKLVTLPRRLSLRHGLVVGPSGAGKSFGLFLPNAARLAETSCVFTDPKNELWHYSSGFHNAERYAPTDVARSCGFNWVPLCKDARHAEIIARALVESGNVGRTEQAWLDMEAALLSALFAHAATLPIPTPLTAYRLLTRSKEADLLRELENSASPLAQEQASVFALASDRMRGSILPVVAARLQFLRDPSVARFTSSGLLPPDFTRLRYTPTALYYCLPEQDATRLRPLSAVFFTVLIEQLARGEPSTAGVIAGNGKDMVPAVPSIDEDASIPVTLLLDEFGSIGKIPDFDTTISVARGRDVAIWLGVQSLSQLTSRYGKDAATTILANCHTKVALSGMEGESADYFSKTSGQGTVWARRRGTSRRPLRLLPSSLSSSAGEQGRPVLTPDEVRRLGESEMLVLIGNRQPMLLTKEHYNAAPRTARTKPLGYARAIPLPKKLDRV